MELQFHPGPARVNLGKSGWFYYKEKGKSLCSIDRKLFSF